MKLTKILSQAVHTCIDRFPLPAAFATALALYTIYVILAVDDPDRLVAAIMYFLSVGLVLSLSLTLWSEEQALRHDSAGGTEPGSSRKRLVVWAVCFLILLVDTLYLYHIEFGYGGRGYETAFMHASAIFALLLTVFFLSFSGERNDIPSWNFALRLIASLVVCFIIGLILWGGLSLLYGSMDWLFNVHLGWKWYAVTGVLLAGYLPLQLFLGRIPDGEEKHDREPLRSAFLAGVVRYLFLPLEVLYIVVLFIYAIQIILRWELPNGQVSWLVIVSMIGLIGIEFGLYPTRHAENRSFDHSVARLLPLVLTPLLLLMTVGIVRRFSDYGITIARLYLATLNAWFYVVCLGLFLTRARRIHWIPISFALLFLLTSALPFNYTSISRSALLRQAERALTRAGATAFPIDAKRYAAAMQMLPAEEASAISSKLKYLEQTFNSATIAPLVSQDEEAIHFNDFIIKHTDGEVLTTPEQAAYSNSAERRFIPIPEGYTGLYTDISVDRLQFDVAVDTVEVPVHNDEVSDTVIVSLRGLKSYSEKMPEPVALPTTSGNALFFLQYFYLYYSQADISAVKPTLTLHGYLLLRSTPTPTAINH